MHTAIVRRVLAATLIFPMALLGVPTPVLAGTVGTATVIQLEERQQQMGRVRAMLAREDVRQAMIQLGVAPEDAQQRVEALSPDELATVEQRRVHCASHPRDHRSHRRFQKALKRGSLPRASYSSSRAAVRQDR